MTDTPKHPKRGTPGTGKWAGYVAAGRLDKDGRPVWIRPVDLAAENKLWDRMHAKWAESEPGAKKTGGNL